MEKTVIVDHVSIVDTLTDVSFTLQKGEMVGLIGTKDSGKTTISKLISGLIKPSSGFVSVSGFDPSIRPKEFLKQISVFLKNSSQNFKNLAPIDILEITKEMYGLSNRDFGKNLNDLAQYIKDPVLLDLLIFKPNVLVLDEPAFELESVFEYNKRNGSTTLITSDCIDNLLGIVRRVILIDSGTILFDGAIDEVMDKYANDKFIKMKLTAPVDPKVVSDIAAIKKYSYPDLQVATPRSVALLTAAELMQNLPIRNLVIEELPVEEIIKKIKL